MGERSRSGPVVSTFLLLALATTVVPVGADEPVLLAVESRGVLPDVTEGTLDIRGIAGRIAVRPGADDSLKFAAVAVDDRERAIDVRLEKDGGRILVRPDVESTGVWLEVVVPARMGVDVETERGPVTVTGIRGRTRIVGSAVEADVRNVLGAVEVDVRGGRVGLSGIDGEVQARLTEVPEARIQGVEGRLYAEIEGGSATLADLRSDVDLDVRGANCELDTAALPISVQQSGGRVLLSGLTQGAEVRASGGLLSIENSSGTFSIETDANVTFRDLKGDVHVDSYGGALDGEGNEGLVEVITRSSRVGLRRIEGPVRIQGDDLDVEVDGIGGELLILATASNVVAKNLAGSATLHNEFGDILLDGTKASVEVESRDGLVDLRGLNAAVRVTAEGAEVVAQWLSVAFQDDAFLRNDSGGVTVALPERGAATVDARSRYGRVESEIEGLEADGGDSLSGRMGRGTGPRIEIQAEGDVRLVPMVQLDSGG